MAEIIDDKSQHCIDFLLSRLQAHQAKHAGDANPPPFFLGLNGVQGAGKTVLVTILRKTLSSPPTSLPTLSFSLDDIYLTHADQLALAHSHPANPLLQHRGQPSTHDVELGKSVFESLRENRPTRIPAYDKAAFGGEGDRVDEANWEVVNDTDEKKVRVVIFEGWCVGFRARGEEAVRRAWEEAKRRKEEVGVGYEGRLGYVSFEDVKAVDEALRAYDAFTDQLDALIHIDAENTHFVYDWRQEQERSLRAVKGAGMTVDQVNNFVDGYYPSYELYTPTLREGVFKPRNDTESQDDESWKGRQLRLVVDRQRKVSQVIRI